MTISIGLAKVSGAVRLNYNGRETHPPIYNSDDDSILPSFYAVLKKLHLDSIEIQKYLKSKRKYKLSDRIKKEYNLN